jgi:Spy/CpxP family protein refolding chaperone
MIERLLESPEIAEAAGITEEQQAMLRDARFESKTREIELRADLEKTGLEQARLMTEETVDEAAVLAAVEKAGALRTELAKLKIGQVLLVKKTLTPEQLKKLHETARQFKQHGRGEGKHDGKKRAEREGPPPEDEGM